MQGPVSRFASLSRRPMRMALAVFFAALLITGLTVWKLEQREADAERLRFAVMAGDKAYAVQLSLERALSASYAVAAVLRQNKGQLKDFEGLTQEMLPLYPGIANMAIAPGGVVTDVAPRAGNERVIGLDQLNDAKQGAEARRARDMRQLTLAGPLELVQGGTGVVGRLQFFWRMLREHLSFGA